MNSGLLAELLKATINPDWLAFDFHEWMHVRDSVPAPYPAGIERGPVQEQGFAVPSLTTLGGRFAIRVCVTSHRSRRSDFRMLVEESSRLGIALRREAELGEGTR